MTYVLVTDLLSLLERGNPDADPLLRRLSQIPGNEVATTIVTYEEQMRGWLARAAQANTSERMVAVYAHLQKHIETFSHVPLLPFDERAAAQFERLRREKVRIGTMDLRIAAIALSNDATLLTRNLNDFRKVPGLQVEDWSFG